MTEASVRPDRRRGSRLARIQATRSRVLTAATDLFISQGYLTTTMGEIASASGVAVQTIYLRFGGKAALLKASFDVAVSGDDEPLAMVDRPWVEELRREPDLERALRLLASNARKILERAVPLFTRIEQGSADPELAELLVELKQQKLEMVGIFEAILRTKKGFDPRVTSQQATDLLYAMGSEELFRLLCVERQWSSQDWEGFLVSSLLQLFDGPSGEVAPTRQPETPVTQRK